MNALAINRPGSAPAVTAKRPRRWVVVFALAKPRLAAMSVLTTMVAYVTAPRSGASWAATLVGTSLAAAGALALNQWWEWQADARMRRTRGRPIPQGELAPAEALAWSVGFAVAGIAVLACAVNPLAALLAFAIIALYGLVYTPLKRHTRWATEVGAVSGALPALLGNAAAGDWSSRPGLALALTLWCWQMPHFFAIGWKHRADYRAAGFRLRPAVDATGSNTAAWSLGHAVTLAALAPVLWWLHWIGPLTAGTATAAGAMVLARAWRFWRSADRETAAHRLFLASLCHLPIVLAAMLVERGWLR